MHAYGTRKENILELSLYDFILRAYFHLTKYMT
jgi:hypothetical protein